MAVAALVLQERAVRMELLERMALKASRASTAPREAPRAIKGILVSRVIRGLSERRVIRVLSVPELKVTRASKDVRALKG